MESLVRPVSVAVPNATRVSALLPAALFVIAWIVWGSLTLSVAS